MVHVVRTPRALAALAVLLGACAGSSGCTAAAPPVAVTSLPREIHPVPALITHATAHQVRAVRSAVQRALSAELAVADQRSDGSTRFTPRQRLEMLTSVDVPQRAADIADGLARTLSREGPHRTGGRFAVDRWQGVQVVGHRAKAFVTGHSVSTPTPTDSQSRDDGGQYQVLLVRTEGRWLVDEVRVGLTEQG